MRAYTNISHACNHIYNVHAHYTTPNRTEHASLALTHIQTDTHTSTHTYACTHIYICSRSLTYTLAQIYIYTKIKIVYM